MKLLNLLVFMVLGGSLFANISPTLSYNGASNTLILEFNGIPSNVGYNSVIGFNSLTITGINLTGNFVSSSNVFVSLTTPPIAQHATYNSVNGGNSVMLNNVSIFNPSAVTLNLTFTPTNSLQSTIKNPIPNVSMSVIVNPIPPQTAHTQNSAKWNYNRVLNACNSTVSIVNASINFSLTANCFLNLNKTVYAPNVLVDAIHGVYINVPPPKLNIKRFLPIGGGYYNSTLNATFNTSNVIDILTNSITMQSVLNHTAKLGCANVTTIYSQTRPPLSLCTQYNNQSLPSIVTECTSFDFLSGKNFTQQGSLCIAKIAALANSSAQFWHGQTNYWKNQTEIINKSNSTTTFKYAFAVNTLNYTLHSNHDNEQQWITVGGVIAAIVALILGIFAAALVYQRNRPVTPPGRQ